MPRATSHAEKLGSLNADVHFFSFSGDRQAIIISETALKTTQLITRHLCSAKCLSEQPCPNAEAHTESTLSWIVMSGRSRRRIPTYKLRALAVSKEPSANP